MIIGIGGEKLHGKDTVANYLAKHYGYKQMAFADKLKAMCAKAFELNLSDMYDEKLKELPFKQQLMFDIKHYNSIMKDLFADGYVLTDEKDKKIYNLFLDKFMFTSIRDVLQFVGTDILRNLVDAEFHYNSVARPFKQLTHGVVSDCRFKNERDNLIEDFRATLIKVVRPSMQKNSTSNHESENSLGEDREYNYIVLNDGSLQELYDKIDYIMDELQINKETV